jgi:hypothetical protein
MNDTIKLPENNYAFKRTYDNYDNLNGGTKPLKPEIIKKREYKEYNEYKDERIQFQSKEYIPTQKITQEQQQEMKERKEMKDKIESQFYKKHKFELDMFKLTDYEFVNWANQHTTHSDFLIMAVMAEMKKSPKMRNEIERLRVEVDKIPLMPIHEYKKLRKLGDRYTSFLRQLKHEYGNHLLRLLYLSSLSSSSSS